MQAEIAAGHNPQYSDAQYNGWANEIYNAGISDPVNTDTIVRDLIQPVYLIDLLKIIEAFGIRNLNTGGAFNSCALLKINCNSLDLPSFIRIVLASQDIAKVNGYYSDQNINYNF